MTVKRIYMVHHHHSKNSRLIRAANVSQAIRFVANEEYDAHVASQFELVDLVTKGVAVEDAEVNKAEG